MAPPERILITGAAGFIGSRLLAKIREIPALADAILATDVAPLPEADDTLATASLDIRDERAVREAILSFRPTTVIHLAAMVTPPPGDTRQLQYDVDVLGTRHVVEACVEAGVERFLYTSSGAAYGYHPENARPLKEADPVRGNEAFAYAHHKRLVEEYLADVRQKHPELQQLIFRVSTVLGPTTDNQITALFERPVVTGIRGSEAPFCVIADDDVVDAFLYGLREKRSGVYNLTGDGVLNLSEIASLMGGRYVALPEKIIARVLTELSRFNLGPYGPEQVLFLKHRPVLDNQALKEDFGFTPRYTSRQAFERYRTARLDDTERPVVLITGAAGGLGSALALEHAHRGARLVLTDRDADGLERIYLKLRARGQRDVCIITADITSDDDCQRIVDEALQAFGELDLLYNNAGVPLRELFIESAPAAVEKVLDVNVMGSVRITHAALPHLIQRGGRIGVVSSVAGFAPLTGRTAYSASKHALHGFFESLRTEVADQGVSITLICPTYLNTEFRSGARDGASELSTEEAAREIADAVLRRRRQVLVGATAQAAWWLTRLVPGVFDRLMRRSVKKEFS